MTQGSDIIDLTSSPQERSHPDLLEALNAALDRAARERDEIAAVLMPSDMASLVTTLVRANIRQRDRIEALIETMMPAEVVSPAASLQAQRNAQVRTDFLTRRELLDSDQVAELLHSTARNRASVAARLTARRQAVSVKHRGRRLFPAFQFDLRAGAPLPVMAELVPLLVERGLGDWQACLWLTTPSGWLGGAEPAALLASDPARVLAAAAEIGRSGG